MKKLYVIALGTLLWPISIVFAETKPSVESAHGFIIEVLRAGGRSISYPNNSHFPRYSTFGSKIDSVSGQKCTTKISISYTERYGKYGEQLIDYYVNKTVSINWGDISKVATESLVKSRVGINGTVHWSNGDTRSGITIYTESEEMAARLANAMNFLREQCDTKKSQYGF